MIKKGFTNPITDGISGFVSKGIRYLEKEIYYFPFNIAPSSEYFLKLDGSIKLRENYPSIEANYDSADETAIYAKDNFPKMTADNKPAPYVAKAVNVYGTNNAAWKAFDKSNGIVWNTQAGNKTWPAWIELHTDANYLLTSYTIRARSDGGGTSACPSLWQIFSYDDSNYNNKQIIHDMTTITTIAANKEQTFTVPNPLKCKPAKVFRLNITRSGSDTMTSANLSEITFKTITETQYLTMKSNFVLPNLIDYENSMQGYVCLQDHVATYK